MAWKTLISIIENSSFWRSRTSTGQYHVPQSTRHTLVFLSELGHVVLSESSAVGTEVVTA
jgi:hypothetical protein